MRKLLIVVLLFMGSSVWAQTDGLTPSPDNSTSSPAGDATATPEVSPTSVVSGPDIGSTPIASQTVVLTDSQTPQISPAATLSGTSSALPKPPVMSMAATPESSHPVGEHFVFQLDGGSVMPMSSAASTVYGTGFGFDGRIGYAFDDVFSIGLEMGFYDLGVTPVSLSRFGFPAGAASNTSHIPVLLDMQIYFGDSGGPIQPYLVLAGGLSFDSDNIQGAAYTPEVAYSWVNFEFDPAIGVAFMLNRTSSIFIQGKCAMDFDDYNTTDLAVESADTPIILVPLQAGFNFSL